MVPSWGILLVAFAYLATLFAIAFAADRRADTGRSVIDNPNIYALSLAVYCTTWTYYGSVGRAAATGIGFLPIYLGPTLTFALGGFVIQKIIRIAKANRITSIADFIASRYGKSQLLGGLVTVVAVIGVVPYIALQLKAVSGTFTLLTGEPANSSHAALFKDSALYVALLMAGFTILYGTRHLDATERHEGMVAAIAFESAFKLFAFLAVGLYVTFGIYDGFADIFARAHQVPRLAELMLTRDGAGYGSWTALTVLSMLAVLLLPRQFQITVVENVNESHVRRAIWLFPAYLFAINLFVLPIALGGMLHFPTEADADSFVLTLPIAHGHQYLSLLAFLGGLSAATGMVIVETIALATMICNDLAMPLLFRLKALHLDERSDLSKLLIAIRRGAIVLVLLLGYLYFRLAGEAYALVGIGLISFAAVAQFAPVLIGGLYWKGGTRPGALAGLVTGTLVWAYTLLLPSFAKSGWLPAAFLDHGPWGIALLKPQQLFGLMGLDEITHSLLWSMGANIAAYLGVSLLRSPNAVELRQAALFVDARPAQSEMAVWRGSASVHELLPLAARFLGRERAEQAFRRHAHLRGIPHLKDLPADAELAHFAETLLAGAIGAASARVMIASVVEEEPVGLDEVLHILDEASQVRAYSQELEAKSLALEKATAELRSANERLLELDRLKDDFIATVTHELRTPLTSIRALSEMLQADPKIHLEQRARFLAIIVQETERLSRLINQILDLAKLESGRADWICEPVDVCAVAKETLESLAPLVAVKAAQVETELAVPGPKVMADRDRLKQVTINLVSNALKFIDRGGRIQLSVTQEDELVRVCVADNGPGIAPEEQGTIFEKFRQGGDSLTSKPQGTGLGLPISRQIVEHFGGRLWVESASGQGARFIFTLPRLRDHKED